MTLKYPRQKDANDLTKITFFDFVASPQRDMAMALRCRERPSLHVLSALTTRTLVIIFHLDMHIQRNYKSFVAIALQPYEITDCPNANSEK